MPAVDVQLDVVGDSDFSGSLSGGHLYIDLGLSGDSTITANASASLPVTLDVSGDSSMSASPLVAAGMTLALSGDSALSPNLRAAWSLQDAMSGDSAFTATLLGSETLMLGLIGDSAFTAAPSIEAGMSLNFVGDSILGGVVLLRPPFVAGPPKGTPPANPFPGLQVGRLPPVRTSSPVVNPNPPRSRKPPEEPDR